MGRRPEGGRWRQAEKESAAREALRQLVLPMVAGAAATKDALFGLVQRSGLFVMQEFFAREAEKAAGAAKGRHLKGRRANHWGTADTEFPFAGRRIVLPRPRVLAVGGGEMALRGIEELRELDPVSERVIEQILLGVSTRGYGRSLERLPEAIVSRGTSKSAVSRHIVEGTRSRVEDFLTRGLEELDLAVLVLDGLRVAEQCVVVALGIAVDGTKHPLGVWQGSTENSRICTELLQDLLGRGLKIEGRVLCVIDGGKGLRKALSDALGDAAVVQRCQVHKMGNLREHLPEKRHAYVIKTMREAYAVSSAAAAAHQTSTTNGTTPS